MRSVTHIDEEIFRLKSFIIHCKHEIEYYLNLDYYDACLSRIIGCMSATDEINKLLWIKEDICPICLFPYEKKEGMNWCNCGDRHD